MSRGLGLVAVLAIAVLAGCSAAPTTSPTPAPRPTSAPAHVVTNDGLPGMPPVTDPHNVYAAAGADALSATARTAKPLAVAGISCPNP